MEIFSLAEASHCQKAQKVLRVYTCASLVLLAVYLSLHLIPIDHRTTLLHLLIGSGGWSRQDNQIQISVAVKYARLCL